MPPSCKLQKFPQQDEGNTPLVLRYQLIYYKEISYTNTNIMQ